MSANSNNERGRNKVAMLNLLRYRDPSILQAHHKEANNARWSSSSSTLFEQLNNHFVGNAINSWTCSKKRCKVNDPFHNMTATRQPQLIVAASLSIIIASMNLEIPSLWAPLLTRRLQLYLLSSASSRENG